MNLLAKLYCSADKKPIILVCKPLLDYLLVLSCVLIKKKQTLFVASQKVALEFLKLGSIVRNGNGMLDRRLSLLVKHFCWPNLAMDI